MAAGFPLQVRIRSANIKQTTAAPFVKVRVVAPDGTVVAGPVKSEIQAQAPPEAVLEVQPDEGESRKSAPGPRTSVASANDYTVTEDEAAVLFLPVLVVSFGFAMSIGMAFLIGINVSYSINQIVSGDRETVTSTSSTWLSICVTTLLIVAFLIQQFWGHAGSWWGRKRVLVIFSFSALLFTVLGLLAHVLELPELWVLAHICGGIGSGSFSTVSSYISDLSTEAEVTTNFGRLQAMGAFFIVFAMILNAVISKYLTTILIVSVVMAFLWLILNVFFLQDLSPPVWKRTKPTAGEMCMSLLVCTMVKDLCKQTSHTICLLAVIFFGNAAGACVRIYAFSFSVEYFDVQSQELGLLVLVSCLIGGIIVGKGSKYIEARKGANYLMWLAPVGALYVSFGPQEKLTMWMGMLLGALPGFGGSFLNALLFGQLSAKRRGELTALHSVAEKMGGLLGTIVITPVSIFWVDQWEETGKSIALKPPMVEALFVILVSLFYYIGRFVFGHQDKYGVFVVRVKEDEHGEEAEEGQQESGKDDDCDTLQGFDDMTFVFADIEKPSECKVVFTLLDKEVIEKNQVNVDDLLASDRVLGTAEWDLGTLDKTGNSAEWQGRELTVTSGWFVGCTLLASVCTQGA